MTEPFRNSLVKFFLVLLAGIIVSAYYHHGNRKKGVIWSDQEGYYIYLPAVFIHGGFEGLPCFNGCTTVETDDRQMTFTKYTYGVALLESPFFLASHAAAKIFRFGQDGRSLPYVWGIMLAAVFYLSAGSFFMYRLLLEKGFGEKVSLSAILLLILGTNLFYYTFRESGMSHVYSLFLISALMFTTDRGMRDGRLKWSTLSGILLALSVLIRPTNIIVILIPLLWGVESLQTLKLRFSNFPFWISAIISSAVLFVPQLCYWKSVLGSYFVYSYGNESFTNWLNPKVYQVLFSHQNGWVIYSPIVLLAFFGMMRMIRQQVGGWQVPVIILSLATYIFGSWWAWWFGGAYGHRCFVELLPLLVIPMAFALRDLQKLPLAMRSGSAVVIVLVLFVNLRMSYNYFGMWDGPDWTWASYLHELKRCFWL